MRRRRIGAALIIAGAVAIVPALVVTGLTFWHTVFAPTYAVPGTVQVHLGAGDHIVFEQTGHSDRYGPVSVNRDRGVTITAGAVTVRGPDGRSVPVWDRDPTQTITRNDDQYRAAVQFDAPTDGDYRIRVAGARPGRMMIGRPLGDVVVGLVPWFVVGVVGALGVFVGLLLVLLGGSRTGPASAGSPARWADDPYGAHRLRYWDGAAWTEHVAD